MTVQNRDLLFVYDVMKRIKYTGSKIRLNDARYLVHALVDGYVEVGHTTRAVLDAVCRVSSMTVVCVEVGHTTTRAVPCARPRRRV
jgi:hypothetical protein